MHPFLARVMLREAIFANERVRTALPLESSEERLNRSSYRKIKHWKGGLGKEKRRWKSDIPVTVFKGLALYSTCEPEKSSSKCCCRIIALELSIHAIPIFCHQRRCLTNDWM